MSKYDHIKRLSEDGLEALIKLGFLKSTFRRNVAIYERYLALREQGEPKTDAVVFTADEFNISDRHVFRIIEAFSEDKSIA